MPTPAAPASSKPQGPGTGGAGPPHQTAWEGHPKGSTAYGRILAGLAFAGVATFAQLYSTQAVLPLMSRDLGVTAAEAALTISLATVGLAVTVIPWSFLADRIGRVRAMAWGISAATASARAGQAPCRLREGPGLVAVQPRLLSGLERDRLGGRHRVPVARLDSARCHRDRAGMHDGGDYRRRTSGGR